MQGKMGIETKNIIIKIPQWKSGRWKVEVGFNITPRMCKSYY
jgi:hypothetical protein